MRVAALLGLLVLGACSRDEEALAPAAVDVKASGLRVVSYNAWGVPFSSALGKRFRELSTAVLGFKPDVVCLQEVWITSFRKKLVLGLGNGFHVAESAGGGLMVASRFPIVAEKFTAFPMFKGLAIEERIAKKGFLEVVLDTPRGTLRIVTTHLALRGPRARQLEFVLERLDKRRDMPLIFTGDLNTPPVFGGGLLNVSYARCLAQGLIDCNPPKEDPNGLLVEGPPTRVGWPRPRPGRGWQPDYVFYRPNGKPLRHLGFRMELNNPETALSDHNLLLVDFEQS